MRCHSNNEKKVLILELSISYRVKENQAHKRILAILNQMPTDINDLRAHITNQSEHTIIW